VTKVHENEDFYYVREAEARCCPLCQYFVWLTYSLPGYILLLGWVYMIDEQRSRILFPSPVNARLGPKVQLGSRTEFEEYEMLCCVDGLIKM
jgi:hypothetical protein